MLLLDAATLALNLSLAWLVASLRPRTTAIRMLLVLFLAGAAFPALDLLAAAGAPPGALFHLLTLAEMVTFLPLLALPFLVPWSRLSPRGERWLLRGGGALVALVVGSAWANAWMHPGGPAPWPPWWAVADFAFIPFALAYAGVPALGAVLFLDAFLGARNRVHRDQATLFLAAYALKVGAVSGLLTPLFLAPDFGSSAPGFATGLRNGAGVAMDLVVLVALLAVPLAMLAARRLGGPRAGAGWGPEAFVLAMLALGVALRPLGMHGAEYLVLRPLLLAFGILQVQLLEVEAREHRVALGTAVVAAVGSSFLVALQGALRLGGDAAFAAGAGFLAALVAGAAFGWPMLRLALPGADPQRRLHIYRAALDAARSEGRGAEALEALRPLRQELGVSDREHDLVAAGLPDAAAAGPLRPGALFVGRYRVARELGRGAAGEVYLARDERLGREVAIKRLGEAHRRDAAALALFQRETRLASALHHPRIVAVHDVETVGSDAYLVMEYVPGGSLEQRLRLAGPLPEPAGAALALDVLDALAALHGKGILHRDVKPGNILLDEHGRAKLGDFTVAREAVSGDTVGFTGPGAAAGTPAYMAPEQARGLPATQRSDVYAAGAVLHAALAGRPPVDVAGLGEFEARLRVAQDVPALPLQGASAAMNRVLARALARDPAERFASAAEMAAALRPLAAPRDG